MSIQNTLALRIGIIGPSPLIERLWARAILRLRISFIDLGAQENPTISIFACAVVRRHGLDANMHHARKIHRECERARPSCATSGAPHRILGWFYLFLGGGRFLGSGCVRLKVLALCCIRIAAFQHRFTLNDNDARLQISRISRVSSS